MAKQLKPISIFTDDKGGLSVVELATRQTDSGNPNFDPATGRFDYGANPNTATGVSEQGPQATPAPASTVPEGYDVQSWRRRMDSVRDLARRVDGVDPEALNKFMSDRLGRDVTTEELNAFAADVREQQLDDLVDALDQQERSSIQTMTRKYKSVRVQTPKGWVGRALATLSPEERESVIDRLAGRGHDPENIAKQLAPKEDSP